MATVEDSLAGIRTKNYVFFGGAGCLNREIAHGRVMVPTAAYRDEGTSYHYAPAADYIAVKNAPFVAGFMRANGLPCVEGKTWTTDSFYRETRGHFEKRRAEGCISVEMECAALQAMCDFRGLELYMFLTRRDRHTARRGPFRYCARAGGRRGRALVTKSSAAGSVIGRPLRRFSLRYFDLFANMISLLKR